MGLSRFPGGLSAPLSAFRGSPASQALHYSVSISGEPLGTRGY